MHLVVMYRTFLTEQTSGCPQVRAELGLYHTSLANDDWMAPFPIPAVLAASITLWDLRLSQIWGGNSALMGREPGGATVAQCLKISSDFPKLVHRRFDLPQLLYFVSSSQVHSPAPSKPSPQHPKVTASQAADRTSTNGDTEQRPPTITRLAARTS
jgi:hypothetical protein